MIVIFILVLSTFVYESLSDEVILASCGNGSELFFVVVIFPIFENSTDISFSHVILFYLGDICMIDVFILTFFY
jgi:hypothetical protein